MAFVLIVHVIVSILLVITILMQAGKGGGLAESFTSAESMFGTQTNSFMVRLSTILATIFLATSLVLAVFGSKGEKSLMANKAMLPAPIAVTPKEEPVSVKIEPAKPMESINSVVNAAQ